MTLLNARTKPPLVFLFASTAFVSILVLSASIGTFAFRFMASMGGVKLGFWPALGTLAAAVFASRVAGSVAKAIVTALAREKEWTPVVAEVVVGMLAWIAVVPPLTGLSWTYTIGVAVVMNLVAGAFAFAVNFGVRHALRT